MPSPNVPPEPLGAVRGLGLLALFLSSGATSLVYQILWVRELSLTLGSTVYAISIVVSAFMGGLALGSALLGRRAERSTSGLRLYAWLEGGIGLCALALPAAFGGILALAAALPPEVPLAGALPFVASFAALLVPTTLMGGTLPVLARYVAGFDTARGVSIGLLYSLNTLGALLGAALTGFVLVRALGIQATTLLAAGANLAICAAGLALARRWPQPQLGALEPRPRSERVQPASLRAPVVAIYCVNGLAGLGLQLLWTRTLALFGTNTTYAFTIVLTTYLLGLAAGAMLVSSLLPRLRAPAGWLALLQIAAGAVAAASPIALAAFGLDFVSDFELRLGVLKVAPVLASALLAALLMLPATLLMGACFPLVAQIVAGVEADVGSRVGRAYALNTLGAVAGSLLAAFVLLPALGIERSILLCAGLLVASGLYLALRCTARPAQAFGTLSLALCLLLWIFASDHFRGMLEQRLGHPLRFYREGVETTVGVFDSERAGRPVLVINNVALEDTGVVHKLLAHLPALLHEDPRSALVLGFGVGMTSQALSTHDLAVNDCVEISPAVVDAAPYFASLNGNILERGDPSFRLFVTDGRRLLLQPGEPYDIIVLDANSGSIRNAGVGKLYTREFFEMARRRLSRSGILSLYVPLDSTQREYEMVVRTFLESFPHAALFVDRAFGDTSVLIGSLRPLAVDVPRYLERVLAPPVQADLAPLRLDEPGLMLSSFLMGDELLRVFAAQGELNTDDRPRLEFFDLGSDPFAENDRALSDLGFWLHRDSVIPLLHRSDAHPRGERMLRFLRNDRRASYALFESWLHAWWGDIAGQRVAARRAAALHPEAEYLRAGAGYGRGDLQRAERGASAARDVLQVAHAGFVALERAEYARAERHFAAALAQLADPDALAPESLSALHLGMARAARALGRYDTARRHLARAGGGSSARALERAELALANDQGTSRSDLTRNVAEAALRSGDWARVQEAYASLDAGGAAQPLDLHRHALALERLGDPAGAVHYWERALAGDASLAAARAGRGRAALAVGLRRGVLEAAFAPGDPRRQPGSPFVAVPQDRALPPALDSRDPAPWLELARRHLAARQVQLAYRMARAARTLAPDQPAPLAAVGASAEWLALPGSHTLSRVAYTRALALDPDYAPAQQGLARLAEREPEGR